MDLTPSLEKKDFYRFTGPPEHWLTAIKYMTWGLNKDHEKQWKKIQPGDVFFIHSTGTGQSMFKNARSGVIGIGVVGSNFSVKENFLWIKELVEQQNLWPFLIPISEIYLFSDIPDSLNWESPDINNKNESAQLINLLLKNSVPLSNIKGFPQMGSFSKVSPEVTRQILYDKKPLYMHEGNITENIIESKPTKLEEIKKASESLRYSESLRVFSNIKQRIINKTQISYTKNNELLARAEESHSTILQQLIDIFRNKGYSTRSNKFVDLFAHNDKQAYLFEVKSTTNNNFRSQARKGIVQLYEYDYFEIKRYVEETQLKFQNSYRILVPSTIPQDKNYINFINYLDIGLAVVKDQGIKSVGIDSGFSKI